MGVKTVYDSSLTAVADAIRAKTGKSASMEFPSEFVSEIASISGGEYVNFELLKNVTTTEDVAHLNFDLGKAYDEVIVVLKGKWTSSTTGAFVVINLCSSDAYAETGQSNKAFETNQFYNNNIRMIVYYIKKINDECNHIGLGAGNGAFSSTDRAAVVPNPSVYLMTERQWPALRYIHIGSFNTSHQYESGLSLQIFGR